MISKLKIILADIQKLIVGLKVIKGIGNFYNLFKSLNLQDKPAERSKTEIETFAMNNFLVSNDSVRNKLELKISKQKESE